MASCKKCGNCCRYLIMIMDDIDWDAQYVSGRRGYVNGEYGVVPCVCKHLTEDNLCGLYPNWPKYCADNPKENHPYLRAIDCRFYEEDE